MISSVETAVWNPTHKKTESRAIVEKMEVGQCLRIVHDDMSCKRVPHYTNGKPDYACSLSSALRSVAKKYNKLFESYHEGVEVMVVRRVK